MTCLAVDAHTDLAEWELACTWFVMALRAQPDQWRCQCRHCRGEPFRPLQTGWARDTPWVPPPDFDGIGSASVM